MKVIFQSQLPARIDCHFAAYQYDERHTQNPLYINVRKIANDHADEWLRDLLVSHGQISEQFLRLTKWWWVSSASRLDARPWGQEDVIKPLMFAKGISHWIRENRFDGTIVMTGCPSEVAVYLKEFLPQARIGGSFIFHGTHLRFFRLPVFLIAAIAKTAKEGCLIFCRHVSKRFQCNGIEKLALFESIPQLGIQGSRRYYYGDLLHSGKVEIQRGMRFGCVPSNLGEIKSLRCEMAVSGEYFLLLDCLNAYGFFRSFFSALGLIFLAAWISLRKMSCQLAGDASDCFWPFFIFNEWMRRSNLRAICVYYALTNLMQDNGQIRHIVFPYEEKGIERAILFACKEKNVQTTGHVPHPQHRFLLALQNGSAAVPPRPNSYAVCGTAYLEYFSKDLGRTDEITVWGSDKFLTRSKFPEKRLENKNLELLLLISHPSEIDVFLSWLSCDQELLRNKHYRVQLYKAVNYSEQKKKLEEARKQIPQIEEAAGELERNVERCDFILFNATSAGIVAIHQGRLAVHVAIGDFFQINPCFDRLKSMLSCSTSAMLAGRFKQLSDCSEIERNRIYLQQRELATQIFSCPNPELTAVGS